MMRAREGIGVQLAVAVGLAVVFGACAADRDATKAVREADGGARDAAADSSEPEAGAGGEGADGGDGGRTAADGGAAAHGGPAAGGGGQGGSDRARDAEAPPDAGASSDRFDAEVDAAGESPEAGASRRVRGKLIDFWRHPIGGVEIAIGEASVRTNDRGEFELADIARPYDVLVRFSVTYATGGSRNYRWQFRGLTRSDPTLQVDEPPSVRATRVEATFTGVTYPLPETQRLVYAFGSPHTMWSRAPSNAASWIEGHVWFGPVSTTGMAHVLVWSVDETPNALPVHYDMHAARALALNDGETLKPTLELTAQTIETGVIAGRVTTAGLSSNRRNHVFVRWTDNARIKVVTDVPSTNAFSYPVPKLDNATIILAASSGEYSPGPFAVAHRALLAPDTTDLNLEIPSVPSLIAPAENALNVGPDTTFEWSGKPQVHVLFVENGTTEAIRVVTTESRVRLPRTAADGLALDPSRPYGFWVETHGSFGSVDEAADPGGFLDDYTPGIAGPMEHGEPFGPPRPSGAYAASASRRFMLAQ